MWTFVTVFFGLTLSRFVDLVACMSISFLLMAGGWSFVGVHHTLFSLHQLVVDIWVVSTFRLS